MTSKISVVINTLNEQDNLADCIASVQGFADEIVVCDMYSEDGTVEIARQHGANVVFHERTGFVEPARKFAISQATGEYILVLDADERMTSVLAGRLKEIVAQGRADVVAFGNLFNYFGAPVWYGGFYWLEWRRFFRKQVYLETYTEDEALVHHNFAALTASQNIIHLPGEYHLNHLAYPTIEKFVAKTVGKYARMEGEQQYALGRRFSLWKLCSEPPKEFLRKFVWQGGFKDGVRGLILAGLYAAYRFSFWANLWFAGEKERLGITQGHEHDAFIRAASAPRR
ncbi:MAG: glycosyltransferase family 2 protein [Anaerolineaceae bacterium]|nr:glycosyltransferase family 2 protein [Anaerolineaceae bacterium]